MTAVHLPFGAETPDELCAAYANGSLTAEQRAEVDRWLAAHPEWTPRLRAYQAISSAVRQAASTSAAPDIGSMGGVWAAIDASPQPRPLRAAAPPPQVHLAAPARRRSRPPSWLLAVAASLVVAVAAVSALLVVNRDSGELSIREDSSADTADDEPPADVAEEPPADAAEPPTSAPPTGGAVQSAAQALRDGAEDTAEQDTAHTFFDATATLDFTGTAVADLINAETVSVDITGPGQVQFSPDESVLDTTTTFTGGLLEVMGDVQASTVTKGDDTYVSCDGGEYVLETAASESSCGAFTLGTTFFGPDAGISLLDNADSEVLDLGVEDIEGGPAQRYQLVIDIERDDGSGSDPATVDVWIGVDDGLIRQVTASIATTLPFTWEADTYDVPINLELTYTLSQFGEPVDIPEVG